MSLHVSAHIKGQHVSQSTCMFVNVQTHANTRQSTCLLPVCLSMLKHMQTHANTHAREVACCLYAYPCSKPRRALACSSIFKHTQTHAKALACCLCVCPCSNTRKHAPEHLHVHGALETLQFYTGAAAVPISINL
jgi:hypothetical protein